MMETVFDLLRCALIAASALAIGWPLGRNAPRTRGYWVLILAPLFTPNLLISYAWTRAAYALGAWPGMIFLFYSVMLALKLAPLAALTRHFFPPPLGRDAVYCFHLFHHGNAWDRRRFFWRAAGPMPWIVGAILFLFAFPEFELASLWSLKTWPIRLFDAHAGGLALGETLRLVAFPAGIQLAVLVGALGKIRASRPPRPAPEIARAVAAGPARLGYAIGAASALTFWPLGLIGAQAIAGFSSLSRNAIFPQDLLASLLFAGAAAAIVWPLAAALEKRGAIAVASAAPGLVGPLVIALGIVALFQVPVLRELYDTPAPLLLALILALLPAALILRWLLAVRRPGEALHLARLAGARPLIWDLDTRHRVAAFALLALWAWFEFAASTILAPLQLTPVFARLHNLAHYGQTAALSAMLFAASLAPILVLALTLGLARLYARRDAR